MAQIMRQTDNPTLTVYDFAHSLPLGGAGRDFPFAEDESEGISHSPLVFLGSQISTLIE
jgi:hypothetical protein